MVCVITTFDGQIQEVRGKDDEAAVWRRQSEHLAGMSMWLHLRRRPAPRHALGAGEGALAGVRFPRLRGGVVSGMEHPCKHGVEMPSFGEVVDRL
mmetsp:Transcript_72661/g.201486  ORF Transcript_72661/g.201486 Transcript_72661/m.201486 type:complete len:95 (+) Transcript_72661:107-391(+)